MWKISWWKTEWQDVRSSLFQNATGQCVIYIQGFEFPVFPRLWQKQINNSTSTHELFSWSIVMQSKAPEKNLSNFLRVCCSVTYGTLMTVKVLKARKHGANWLSWRKSHHLLYQYLNWEWYFHCLISFHLFSKIDLNQTEAEWIASRVFLPACLSRLSPSLRPSLGTSVVVL